MPDHLDVSHHYNYSLSRVVDFFNAVVAVFALGVAVYFFRERLFVDAAYYFFHTVNSGAFHIEHGRLVLALSQVIPLAALYAGFGLQDLMVAASVGNALYFIVLALILRFYFKNSFMALGVLLIPIVNQHFLHFSPMLEITYGGGLLFLFYALYRKQDRSLLENIAVIIVLVFVLTSHPEHFISVSVLLPLAYRKDLGWRNLFWWALGVMVLVLIIKLSTFSDYEAGKVTAFTGHNYHYKQLFDVNYLVKMGAMIFKNYIFMWILLILSVVHFIRTRQRIKSLLILTGVFAVVVLVNSAIDAATYTRYIQSMYSPMVAIVLLFFTAEVLPGVKMPTRIFGVVLLVLFMVVESLRIINFGQELSQRTALFQQIISSARSEQGSKFIIDKHNWSHEPHWFSWSVPMEILLFSAEKNSKDALSIVENADIDYGNNRELVNEETFILRCFETVPHDYLNSNLFELPRGNYVPLEPELKEE